MNNLDLDREQWYKERDDRTNRVSNTIEHGIEDYKVEIVYNLNDRKHIDRIFLEICLNVLSRWCRNIWVYDINHKIDKQQRQDLISYIMSNDPFNSFKISDHRCNKSNITLIIGGTIDEFPDTMWINADNWIAGIGKNKFQNVENTNNNLVGVSFAACLGNAALFNNFLGQKTDYILPTWYSLFDYTQSSDKNGLLNPELPDKIELGNILQIGCGAVGSSLVYLLSKQNWLGKLCLVDFDTVKIPNCSSTLVFSASDAINKRLKIDCCEEIVLNNKVSVFDGDYSSFIKENNSSKPDILLCLGNERNIWSTIQNNYPPVVLHATINESWGINMGRHIPLTEWCIMCRFKNSLKTEMNAPCGNSIVAQTKGGDNILGVLPFLSPASATLLLSEIVRLSIDSKLDSNFTIFSLKLNGENRFQTHIRIKDEDCPVCKAQYKSINENLNKYSMYWSFSI